MNGIGIAPHLVSAEMPVMFDNARFWSRTRRSRLTKSRCGFIIA